MKGSGYLDHHTFLHCFTSLRPSKETLRVLQCFRRSGKRSLRLLIAASWHLTPPARSSRRAPASPRARRSSSRGRPASSCCWCGTPARTDSCGRASEGLLRARVRRDGGAQVVRDSGSVAPGWAHTPRPSGHPPWPHPPAAGRAASCVRPLIRRATWSRLIWLQMLFGRRGV